MKTRSRVRALKIFFLTFLTPLLLFAPSLTFSQTQTTPTSSAPSVPDWAQPGSATHVQVPPPADFHRPSRNFDTPIGIFDGQSDVGGAVVPGSASYHAAAKQYTIP